MVATITFSAKVNNPDAGDKSLVSTVTSASTGSNCVAGSTDSRCSSTVPVSILTMPVTARPSTTAPGATVTYTVTNSGTVAYTGAALADSLSGVLDDASYNANAPATPGSVTYSSPNLTWTGNLAAGAVATITFSVTVSNPDIPISGTVTITSRVRVDNPVTSSTLTATAVSGRTRKQLPTRQHRPPLHPRHPGTHPRPDHCDDREHRRRGAGPDGHLYRHRHRRTPYTGATVTDTLNLLDDATHNNDAGANSGAVSYASPVITWTGGRSVHASAVITWTVTVNNPDTGDKNLATVAVSTDPGGSCPPASSNAGCSLAVRVLTPALTIVKTASTTTATAGQKVTYTVVVTDSGQTTYTAATFSDSLSGVLGDASYNNDAAATPDTTVAFSSPDLTWSGDLAADASATVTYSVTAD